MATANFKTQKYFDLYATTDCEYYDEETGEIEFDNYLYKEIQDQIKTLNDNLNFFEITLNDGYYEGLQTYIIENNKFSMYDDPLYMLEIYEELDGKEIYETYGFNKYILKLKILKEIDTINNKLLPQLENFNKLEIVSQAQFYIKDNKENTITKITSTQDFKEFFKHNCGQINRYTFEKLVWKNDIFDYYNKLDYNNLNRLIEYKDAVKIIANKKINPTIYDYGLWNRFYKIVEVEDDKDFMV